MSAKSTKGKSAKGYFDIEANVLFQRYQTFETLVPAIERSGAAHPGEEGRHIEALLRDFLNRHLPLEIRAYSGFIYKPATKVGTSDLSRVDGEDEHSTQIDIIVYDEAHFPVYQKFQEVVIVPPEGVVGLISVKKRLYARDVEHELQCLRQATMLCRRKAVRQPYSALFAFTNADMPADRMTFGRHVYDKIESVYSGVNFSTAVNEVSVFDKAVVFKWTPRSSPEGSATYVLVDCESDAAERTVTGIALQRMLQSIMSVYYERVQMERPGYASFEKGTFNGDRLGNLTICAD